MVDDGRSEVRGLWFTTARRYVLELGGDDLLDAMTVRIDRAYRHVWLEPESSDWYPERALQQSLVAMHAVIAGGRDDVFVDTIESCTVLGINLFFRILMRLGSPVFVLRKAPAMWNHIRRGAGTVTVDVDETGGALHFASFPYFRDPNYRLLTAGVARALVTVCGRPRPEVDVSDFDYDRLTVRVRFK